jgi:hypothetical protein
MLDVSARARALSSNEALATRIDRKSTNRPVVVPMKPIGGRIFAYIEIRCA